MNKNRETLFINPLLSHQNLNSIGHMIRLLTRLPIIGFSGVLVPRRPDRADADRTTHRQPLREAGLLRHAGRQPDVAGEGAMGWYVTKFIYLQRQLVSLPM